MANLLALQNSIQEYTDQLLIEKLHNVKLALIEIVKKPFILDNLKIVNIVLETYKTEISIQDVAEARDIFRSIININ